MASVETPVESYEVLYGVRPATAYPENYNGRYRYFYVALHKDLGFGSMTFPHIGRSQIKFLGQEPPAPTFNYAT